MIHIGMKANRNMKSFSNETLTLYIYIYIIYICIYIYITMYNLYCILCNITLYTDIIDMYSYI